jgi:predicted benzoate:H+ symporter BenE
MAAAPPPGYDDTSGYSRWRVPRPYGASASLQAVGTVAAPLLAGFSLTLIGLVLTSPERIRWPDAALALLTAAVLSLITAVQAGSWARRWDVTPVEMMSWWPTLTELPDYVQDRIVGEQHSHTVRHRRWAAATRVAYDGGILCLLGAVAVLLVPPARWELLSLRGLAVSLAVLGLLGEAMWVTVSVLLSRSDRRGRG